MLRDRVGAHARYELAFLRTQRAAFAAGAFGVVLSAITTLITTEYAAHYLESPNRGYWAMVATQGGTLGWPPLSSFILSLVGVALWSQDVHGDSAHVAYLSFSGRIGTAVTRLLSLAVVATTMALAGWIASIAIGLASRDSAGVPIALIAVKLLRMAICGVALSYIASALTVLTRSVAASLAMLILLPWIAEPALASLVGLSSGLAPAKSAVAYLPFSAISAVTGSGDFGGSQIGTFHQLCPDQALIYASVATAVAAAGSVWGYVVRDSRDVV